MPMKQLPYVDEETCIGCGSCVVSCPFAVLELVNDKAALAKPLECNLAKTCVEVCPVQAITIKEQEY